MKNILLLLVFTFYVPLGQAFTDTDDHPYRDSIDYLQNQYIVQGYDDGTYRPHQTLNRAEFIKIIIASKFDPYQWETGFDQSCFTDIEPGFWYTPYVCFAKSQGIIAGYEDGTFRPSQTINQAEGLKVMMEAYYQNIPLVEGDWHAPYFTKADYLGMGYFSPHNPAPHILTRGEMAYFVAWYWEQGEIDQMEWEDPLKNLGTEELENVERQEVMDDAVYFPAGPHSSPLEVVKASHPGEEVIGGYITDYHQWEAADYAPSKANHVLSLPEIEKIRSGLLQGLNQARKEEGKPALGRVASLDKLSQEFAIHLVINAIYSHSDKGGKDPFERAQKIGHYSFITESMTWQQLTPLDSIAWWQHSDLHWNNIANPDYTKAGIGVVREPNGRYMVILLVGA